MRRRPLPDFLPVPRSECREFYQKYRANEDVRRMILELQRLYAKLDTISGKMR